MERYLSQHLFSADCATPGAVTLPEYEQSTAREVGFREDWLQMAVAGNPDLVIAPCREAGLTDEAWAFWEREVHVESAGSIDILLVSESGRIGIVETKLSYNPEGRRSVVAQTLEYAIHFPEIDVEDVLPPIPEVDGRPFADREAVQSRIQEGDYLLIVAGDRLDARAVKLGRSMLGRHLVHGWDLAMVEVSVYRRVSAVPSGKCLLIPHVRGAIVPEQRQVVRVVVEGDRTRVAVEQVAPVAGTSVPDAVYLWDESRFEQDVRSTNPQMADAIHRLIATCKRVGNTEWKNADFKGRHGKLNFFVTELGPKPLFRLYSADGCLSLQLKAADKTDAAKSYRQQLVDRLVGAGFCHSPPANAEVELNIEWPDWTGKLGAFEKAIGAPAGPTT